MANRGCSICGAKIDREFGDLCESCQQSSFSDIKKNRDNKVELSIGTQFLLYIVTFFLGVYALTHLPIFWLAGIAPFVFGLLMIGSALTGNRPDRSARLMIGAFCILIYVFGFVTLFFIVPRL